jgi:hypothetical protein
MKNPRSVLIAAVLTLGFAAGAFADDAPTTGTSKDVDKTTSQSTPAAKASKSTTTSDTNVSKKAFKVPATRTIDGPPPPPPPPPPPK